MSKAPPLEEPGSPFPPIKEYAFLSDCHTGALLAPDGTVEWLCVPRFDAPSIFGSLLDRGAGGFRLGPYGVGVPGARRYEPGTNILETTWMTPTGWAVVREALCIGPWRDVEDQVTPHTRPPVDQDAAHVLVRTIECVQGMVNAELICEPLFDYGRAPAEWSMQQGTSDQADATGGDLKVRLTTDMRLGIEGNRARARHEMNEGEKRFCALSWSAVLDGPRSTDQAEAMLAETSHYWRTWLAAGHYPDHRLRSWLQRSALALKGLTYSPTGATVAALTTSLPETPHGERN